MSTKVTSSTENQTENQTNSHATVQEYTTPILLMKKLLMRENFLNLPQDPVNWDFADVGKFFNYLTKTVDCGANMNARQSFYQIENFMQMGIDGQALLKMTQDRLQVMFPGRDISTLWIHVESLKFASAGLPSDVDSKTTNDLLLEDVGIKEVRQHMKLKKVDKKDGGVQTQLWQFLLELLTDVNMCCVICWVGDKGAFKLIQPETVAQLWGVRKKRPAMNYEKLSRALRYYYEGDLIHKVCGKRFVYRFVCDLKLLLGYSARELGKLITEQQNKLNMRNDMSFEDGLHNINSMNEMNMMNGLTSKMDMSSAINSANMVKDMNNTNSNELYVMNGMMDRMNEGIYGMDCINHFDGIVRKNSGNGLDNNTSMNSQDFDIHHC